MDRMPRTLVLVLSSSNEPYASLRATVEDTWAASKVDDVDVLFYRGGNELCDTGHELALPVPDDLANAGRKTLASFSYVLEQREFDLVFRPNLSSYVDLQNLRAYVGEHAELIRFYAGKSGVLDEIPFVGGAGYFLSRDLVELAVRNAAEWDHTYLDDVALA